MSANRSRPIKRLRGMRRMSSVHVTTRIIFRAIPAPAHHINICGESSRPTDCITRSPMVSRIGFVECGGNSAPLFSNEPIQTDVQALHGLASCAEWTGVMLSTLLEEAGVDPKAKWIIAEGADSPHLSRSVPLAKVADDAMVAMYQNGERIQPGQGYPMRLWLPGYEGNMNIKFLRRVQVTDQPGMTYYESKIYSAPLPNGKDPRSYFVNEVKSSSPRRRPASISESPACT